jgi:hypothetical protein
MIRRKTPLRRGQQIKRRTYLRAVSVKRAEQLREYAKRRAAYLRTHPVCEVWLRENRWQAKEFGTYERANGNGIQIATTSGLVLLGAPLAIEIHHIAKRRGAMLLDETHWLAVCRANHERIEGNKKWARHAGFLLDF